MSLLDTIPEHPDTSPTELDWTTKTNGLKFKTLMASEKAAYMSRVSLTTLSDSDYLFQCLFDYLIAYKKTEGINQAIKEAQDLAATKQQQVISDLDALTLD